MSKDVTFDAKALDRLVIELKGFPKEATNATYQAINRTISFVVTQTGKIVTKKYAIKSREVKASFAGGIKKPSKTNLNARITSNGHTLSFAHFPFSPNTTLISKVLGSSHEKARVKVTIKRAKGKTTSKNGFVASTGAKSADKVQFNVFKRLSKKRLPIAPVRTLSIPQMISNENVMGTIQETAAKKLQERVDHEIEYRLSKAAGKVGR